MNVSAVSNSALGSPAPRESSLVTVLVSLGCELGLFDELESRGAATAPELARRTGLDEGSVDEWLGAMVEAGRLELDPDAPRYAIPARRLPCPHRVDPNGTTLIALRPE